MATEKQLAEKARVEARAALERERADNWRQYATEREDTAQQVIERHRREHECLLKMLAADRKTIEELRATPPSQAAPVAQADHKTLPNGDWLGDHDEHAWRQLLEARGGCSCHIAPPCNNCVEVPTEDELNAVGFTYGIKENP